MDDPQIDDYVRWGDLEGWVYFKDSNHYLTIEIGVKPKPNCEYTRQEKHKYIHTLVCCFPWDWMMIKLVSYAPVILLVTWSLTFLSYLE